MKKIYLCLVLAVSIANSPMAQDLAMANPLPEDTTQQFDFMNMSLEEMMNIKVTVATKGELTQKETPGIVTVITEEEIQKTGARDLIELLRLVPGFDFGADVQGFVGIGTRGLWAAEGKVLFLVDDHELNELTVGMMPMGNHVAVDNIRQIEIIRGPGSAIYGGFAQLAVIKISTKQAETNGISASTTQSMMGNTLGRSNFNFSIGSNQKQLSWHLAGFYGDAIRSTRNYTDPTGATESFRNNSDIRTRNLNFGIKYKTLSFGALVEQYSNESIDNYGTFGYDQESGALKKYDIKYGTISLLLSNTFKINEKLKIIPEISYKVQRPWSAIDTVGFGRRSANTDRPDTLGYYYYDFITTRYYAKIEALYDPTPNVNLLLGSKYFIDNAKVYDKGTPSLYDPIVSTIPPDFIGRVNYNNISAYAQGSVKTKFANFTAGARYDRHSLGFDAFVPRIAVTRSFEKFHIKLLATQSFRSPAMFNMTEKNIKPEIATVFEIEGGAAIGKSLFVSANIFDITIDKPIVYYTSNDANTGVISQGYNNGQKTGSRGFELEAKLKLKRLYANASYSFYDQANKNTTPAFGIDKNDLTNSTMNTNGFLMGFGKHKVTLNCIYNITDNWSINGNLIYNSEKYAYFAYDYTRAGLDTDGDNFKNIKQLPATFIANVFVKRDNLFVKNLTLSLGCYNLLNQNIYFANPYKTIHPPIPGATREYSVKIAYKLDFKS